MESHLSRRRRPSTGSHQSAATTATVDGHDKGDNNGRRERSMVRNADQRHPVLAASHGIASVTPPQGLRTSTRRCATKCPARASAPEKGVYGHGAQGTRERRSVGADPPGRLTGVGRSKRRSLGPGAMMRAGTGQSNGWSRHRVPTRMTWSDDPRPVRPAWPGNRLPPLPRPPRPPGGHPPRLSDIAVRIRALGPPWDIPDRDASTGPRGAPLRRGRPGRSPWIRGRRGRVEACSPGTVIAGTGEPESGMASRLTTSTPS